LSQLEDRIFLVTQQYQHFLEALRLVHPEAVKRKSGRSKRETWESEQPKFVNALIPHLNVILSILFSGVIGIRK